MKPEERIPGVRVYWCHRPDLFGVVANIPVRDAWSVPIIWDNWGDLGSPAYQTDAEYVSVDYDDFDTWVIMTRAQNNKS